MEILVIILFGVANIALQIYLIKTIEGEKVKIPTVEKPHEEKLTDEQKKKQEELRKNFENLMGFDYEQALKRSDVKGD